MSTHKGDLFPFFTISEDHEELRAAVRNVAENKIAQHAAEVDETGTFPTSARTAPSRHRRALARHLIEAVSLPASRAPHR